MNLIQRSPPVCKFKTPANQHANTFPPPILKKSNCVNKVFYTRVSPKKVTYKVGGDLALEAVIVAPLE